MAATGPALVFEVAGDSRPDLRLFGAIVSAPRPGTDLECSRLSIVKYNLAYSHLYSKVPLRNLLF